MSWRRLALLTIAACGDDLHGPARFASGVSVEGDVHVEQGAIRVVVDNAPSVAPEIDLFGNRGAWTIGMDVANNGGSRDMVLAAKLDWPQPGDVNDLVYVAHNDTTAPTVGIGVTPPNNSHRLELSAQDTEPEMGTLFLRRTPQQQGNLLTINDSDGTTRFALDAQYWFTGSHPATSAALAIKADAVNRRPLVVAQADGSAPYGFQYAADGTGALSLRYFATGMDNLALSPDGRPSFPNGLTAHGLSLQPTNVPATSSSPCTHGELAYDDSFVYVCVADNTWKRSALTSW
jgi:hypothetical protein